MGAKRGKKMKIDIQITPLRLTHTKKDPLNTPIERRVQNNKGYAMLQLPSKLIDMLNIALNSELYVEYSQINPLHSEVKIRLFNKRPLQEESKQRQSQR